MSKIPEQVRALCISCTEERELAKAEQREGQWNENTGVR